MPFGPPLFGGRGPLALQPMKNLTSLVASHGIHWAIEPRIGLQLWQELQNTTVHVHMSEVEARQPLAGSRDGDREYGMEDGVAVISMCGPMTKATTSMSSGCSTVATRRQVRAAAADPDVRAIMLRIDSPGGSVSGTSDLADDVRSAASKKPLMGYGEDLCCSAALWVASQCGSFIANSTAMVGSIGTYCAIADYSGMFEVAGIKVHLVSTGEHKGAGTPGVAITAEQLAEFQREVNELNAHFLAAVSRGRSMPMGALKAIADGRVFVGQHARALGLADGIGSFDQAMADLRNSAGTSRHRADNDSRLAIALNNFDPRTDETFAEALALTSTPAAAQAEATPPESPDIDPSAEAVQPEPATESDDAARTALRRSLLRAVSA